MIELLLRVLGPDGSPQEVRAEFPEGQRIDTLTAAVAEHLGNRHLSGTDVRLWCQRIGTRLDPEESVVGAGLVSGDTIHLLTGQRPVTRDQAEVAGLCCDVISGPRSGSSVPLAAGPIVVGRSSSCDLPLADPTVSKQHVRLRLDEAGSVIAEPMPGVTNPVLLDGAEITEATPMRLGAVLELGACALVVRRYDPTPAAQRDQLGQIPFNRTPYRHPDLSEAEVAGPGRPPPPYEPRPLMVLAMLAPAVAGVAFAVILQRPMFLIFALLSPITMFSTWISERRRGGASHQGKLETFEQRFADWIERFDAALDAERRRRSEAAPDVADLARRARLRTPDLWARNRRSDGFLHLRLGLGNDPATAVTPPPANVDDDPDGRIEAALAERRLLRSVPLAVDLTEQGVIALHGDDQEVAASAAALLIQAAVLHSPDDLVICGASHPDRTSWAWLKWLPHTRTVVSPLIGEHVAVGTAGADDLLHRIQRVIAERGEDDWPRMLLLLDEKVGADSPLVASILEAGPAVGIYVLWAGHSRAMVPRQASVVLDHPAVATGKLATLWTTDATRPLTLMTPDRLDLEAAPAIARSLAPVRDASLASVAAAIPRIAPLLETLRSPSLSTEEVVANWTRPQSYTLRAPIGIGATGPFEVDLVEHGPHALIAGTSGAGKSELLQSMIASLIMRYPPTRLNLLFIDYKGGASSNLFQPAPHTVGYVTNLGANLAMRALVSLRAELDRRMRLLEGRAKDLEEMLDRFPDEAPASLVIVIDEFATLVKEIPDFVTGMVDIAQRGRSLGIHLILATQRPSGAVNDNILANTNLRISLRVLDPADSSSILGSADAAHIPAPLRGRGFARLGAGTLVEFQSAFSGADFTASAGISPVTISDFPEADGRRTTHPAPERSDDEQRPTHLDVVLEAVVEATARRRLSRGRRPWLEEMPRPISLADVLTGRYGEVQVEVPGRDLVLGVRDDPARQVQYPEVIDVEAAGGLLVFGTGGSGRTTTLRTLLASSMVSATPDEVEIYLLDFAGRGLEPLRGLPHVGAVATGDDLEQTTRILMHLRAQVEQRQALLAAQRAESLSAYNAQAVANGHAPLPRLLLAIDGFEAFDRTFERGNLYVWSELLVETVLAGRGVGLHLLAATDRRVSVPASLSNAISARVILRAVDADALIDLGVPPGVARSSELGDGRALLPDGASVQVGLAGDEVSNKAQSAVLEWLSHRSANGRRALLPLLPNEIAAHSLPPLDPSMNGQAGVSFTLGLADLSLAPVVGDVRRHPLTVIGPGESGRSTALRRVATDLRAAGASLWMLADPDSPLVGLELPAHRQALRRDEQQTVIDALLAAAAGSSQLQVLVIDRAEQVADTVGYGLDQVLDHDRIRVLAGFEGATITSFSSPPWQGAFKRSRRLLLLQPDDLGDLQTYTPVRIRLRPGQVFPPGRGVYVDGRSWQLVHVARDG